MFNRDRRFIDDDEWQDIKEPFDPIEWGVLIALFVIFLVWLVMLIDHVS